MKKFLVILGAFLVVPGLSAMAASDHPTGANQTAMQQAAGMLPAFNGLSVKERSELVTLSDQELSSIEGQAVVISVATQGTTVAKTITQPPTSVTITMVAPPPAP